MKRYAFDTGSFELYFAGNEKMKEIYNEIKNKVSKGFTLETNLAELYYKTCQKIGEEIALIRDNSIRNSLIEIKEINKEIARKAGEIKCRIRDISLADSLLAAAAAICNATVITTDMDFKVIKDVKVITLQI